ncbi:MULTISPECIES: MBL fold metallo-hydrolase [Peribacillus]|uniref:MBL fold metallo-hydrolase n=1 Tax=Peribacillus TaxID=2675229 RepID=UPI001912FEF3|nr:MULTISPECIES: MBL fold metallo-hydrolase [unclassified Peribacillus]MBK5443351.1 MBL fold metallo-hydrolase [Peribacillus sp. TH24]MBK5484750.1 MBL fold metallo-hydrolase [Peribacillus sp. TH16]MBK5500069.1 MBL fold metallo-hydrolase [Peribacillus sp. TH14]WMX54885.1 MBL fold metallo-hydrolase [Peribacillus sp. R9-11]
MLLKYFYDEKLAQASYLVGCQATGEAIIVDPSRNIEAYLKTARAHGVRIVGVTETHIHADFLSGSKELASRLGATLYLSDEGGADWKYEYATEYQHCFLRNGDVFSIGNINFEVVHTPGHTPEHISLLVTDGGASTKDPLGIFTGDFVFVGDVGRPDLLEKAAGVHGSSEKMARMMYRSLQQFKNLPDYLQVWPGHGAGSACGKALGAIPSSTIGYEKRTNWALQYDNEDRFIEALLAGQPEAPPYFSMMKRLNKEGAQQIRSIAAPLCMEVSIDIVQEWTEQGIVIDTRPASEFATKHIRGVINIPYNKSFVTWAGWLLDYDRPIYLLACNADVADMINDLQSIGLDRVVATMEPYIIEQEGESDSRVMKYEEVTMDQIDGTIQTERIYVLDVRSMGEWEEGHIPQAKHVMLGHLQEQAHKIPHDKPILVYCKTGGRSAIAASLLQVHGFKEVQSLVGGYEEWNKQKKLRPTRDAK